MYSKTVLLIALLSILLFCSCSKEDIYVAPKRQVSDHIEEAVDLEDRKVLEIINPSGNLVIFRCEEAEIRF
ncbi:MAG: hypothetical protein PHV32_18335, partial [Eubacteriales bacterium]|nr:hypothetical protein [Eubacteriales bacterium]